MQDGKFHIVILKPFNPFSVFGLFIKIMRNKAHLSKHIETYTANTLTITRDTKDTIHFDGEPAIADAEVIYDCKPKSLKVIVGDTFKAI